MRQEEKKESVLAALDEMDNDRDYMRDGDLYNEDDADKLISALEERGWQYRA